MAPPAKLSAALKHPPGQSCSWPITNVPPARTALLRPTRPVHRTRPSMIMLAVRVEPCHVTTTKCQRLSTRESRVWAQPPAIQRFKLRMLYIKTSLLLPGTAYEIGEGLRLMPRRRPNIHIDILNADVGMGKRLRTALPPMIRPERREPNRRALGARPPRRHKTPASSW